MILGPMPFFFTLFLVLAIFFGSIICVYKMICALIKEYQAVKELNEYNKAVLERLDQDRLKRIQEGRPWQSDLEWLQEHPDGI